MTAAYFSRVGRLLQNILKPLPLLRFSEPWHLTHIRALRQSASQEDLFTAMGFKPIEKRALKPGKNRLIYQKRFAKA